MSELRRACSGLQMTAISLNSDSCYPDATFRLLQVRFMSLLPFVDGAYFTSVPRVSWFALRFPGIVFYTKLILIVLRSSHQAKWSTYDGNDWARSSLEVLRALESVGVRFEITGAEHLEQLEGPCLVVGNHMSTLETMVLPCLIQPFHEVTFVVKEALINYPIFKHVMRSRDPIAVTQSDVRKDFKAMLTGGLERLKKGVSLVVFPQGERTLDYDPERFNSIGVKLASRSGVPILPVAIETAAWGLGRIISDMGKIDRTKKVHFAFGAPIGVEGRGEDEQKAITDFIGEKLRGWHFASDETIAGQSTLVDIQS